MKKIKGLKFFAVIVTVIILLTALASCGASKEGMAYDNAAPGDGVIVENSASGGGSNGKTEIGSVSDPSSSNSEYEPKIIKTASVEAETKNYESAIDELEAAVAECGGYIELSRVSGKNYASGNSFSGRTAEYTFRIPADSLDSFLAKSGELLNITSSSTNATDVSNDYYDIKARLSVLETEREMLEKMLSEAKDVQTMLDIETRLYDVIYEIESYETQIRLYDSKIAYSTVTMRVYEVTDLTVVNQDPSFGQRIKTAFTESWRAFAAFCKDTAVNTVYALPAILVIGAIAAVAITLTVRAVRKKKARKEKDASGKDNEKDNIIE